MRQDMHVELDDGTVLEIQADGRDVRAWEALYGRSWLAERLSFTTVAQLAYLAGQRTGVLNGSYPDYESFDAHCTEATGRRTVIGADPTPPGRTGGGSSTSPIGSGVSPRKSNRKGRP